MTDLSQIMDLFLNEFVPSEPIFRSIELYSGDGWNARFNKYEMKKLFKKCLKEQSIVVARNENDKVVGMMAGHQVKEGDKGSDLAILYFMNKYCSWIMSRKMYNGTLFFEKFIKELHYDPKMIMEDFGSKNIFMGDILSVDKSARGLGLGSILLQQSMQIAAEMGCELYFSGLTGNYSQKIYKDLVRHIWH